MTIETAKLKTARELRILASCPHCEFNLNTTFANLHTTRALELVDGTRMTDVGLIIDCDSCCKSFLVPFALVQDLQHAALVLLREA